MLKYLIIQLDDTAVSFCHYQNETSKRRLITFETLKEAIFWSMKENLSIQFLYPDYTLPKEYKSVIAKTYHTDIVPSTCEDTDLRVNADVVVFDSLASIGSYDFSKEKSYVFRATLDELLNSGTQLFGILPNIGRLNIVVTDIYSFTNEYEERYELFLSSLSEKVIAEYTVNHGVQVNLLTDRMMLDGMNNCNAGVETISLCPDGKFYVCPAFYSSASDRYSVGTPGDGLDLKNPQLYRLDHAPLCRICDAWQCRRCVWLNKEMTLEVNTPSREQCVMAHIERNASRMLLGEIRKIGQFLPEKEITEIDYLDPFEKLRY